MGEHENTVVRVRLSQKSFVEVLRGTLSHVPSSGEDKEKKTGSERSGGRRDIEGTNVDGA